MPEIGLDWPTAWAYSRIALKIFALKGKGLV
jgi:hypothetical protein